MVGIGREAFRRAFEGGIKGDWGSGGQGSGGEARSSRRWGSVRWWKICFDGIARLLWVGGGPTQNNLHGTFEWGKDRN